MTLTKTRAELLQHVLEGAAGGLETELAAWLDERDRFEAFLAAHRDKVRKKVRSARDGEALRDVRAELLVASLLARDRRFSVEYEAAGSTSGGPDLTVAFRQNRRFTVEVTRLRAPLEEPTARVRGVLLTKLRQLPAGVPNGLALVTPGALPLEAIESAARQLKQQADKKEEAIFTRRGYQDARGFLAALSRLSAVMVVPDAGPTDAAAGLWPHPGARYPLPRETATALQRCLLPA